MRKEHAQMLKWHGRKVQPRKTRQDKKNVNIIYTKEKDSEYETVNSPL